jgi:hypothetical protein
VGGSGKDLRGRSVLVVEDEMLVAMELESLLEQQGCAVLGPAKAAVSALALLDREQPDAASPMPDPGGEVIFGAWDVEGDADPSAPQGDTGSVPPAST